MPTADDFNFSLRGIKILLCIIIASFMLTGAASCLISGFFFTAYDEISDLFSTGHYAPVLMLMIVVCLIIAVLVELAGALWLLVIEDDMMTVASGKFRDLMNLYTTNREAQFTISTIQYSLNCCGAKGPGDWRALGYSYFMNDVPKPCCFSITLAESNEICTAFSHNGCINTMAGLVDENITGLALSAFFILLIQLMGIIFAFILGKRIRSQKTARDMIIWHIRNIYLADKNIYQPLTNSDTYVNFQNI